MWAPQGTTSFNPLPLSQGNVQTDRPLAHIVTSIKTGIKMCEKHQHNYKHMYTVCSKEQTRLMVFWKRVDEFYCSICLDIQRMVQTTDGEQPDWWFKTGE